MTIPIELIALLLSGNGALITLVIHLLIRIMNKISEMNTQTQVERTSTAKELESLRRHEARNRAEIQWMARHVDGYKGPQQRQE